MIISFEKQKKENCDRYNLYLDGKFFSGIEAETIVKFGLKNGRDIDKDKIEEIVEESESNYAFNKALKLLSKSIKTENEVASYLKSKKINDNSINLALNKLKEYRYIDDNIYIENYVNFYKQKYGKNKIRQNLIQKGLEKDVIELYLNYDDEEEINKIVTEIKKQSKQKEIDLKLKQKIIRNLAYKGYNFDLIKNAFTKLGESDESWDWYNRNREIKGERFWKLFK